MQRTYSLYCIFDQFRSRIVSPELCLVQAVSMPNTVDYPDSSVLRPPAHSVIGETTPVSDDNDDEVSDFI